MSNYTAFYNNDPNTSINHFSFFKENCHDYVVIYDKNRSNVYSKICERMEKNDCDILTYAFDYKANNRNIYVYIELSVEDEYIVVVRERRVKIMDGCKVQVGNDVFKIHIDDLDNYSENVEIKVLFEELVSPFNQ
jgi:hypothetical protein